MCLKFVFWEESRVRSFQDPTKYGLVDRVVVVDSHRSGIDFDEKQTVLRISHDDSISNGRVGRDVETGV